MVTRENNFFSCFICLANITRVKNSMFSLTYMCKYCLNSPIVLTEATPLIKIYRIDCHGQSFISFSDKIKPYLFRHNKKHFCNKSLTVKIPVSLTVKIPKVIRYSRRKGESRTHRTNQKKEISTEICSKISA